MSKGNPCHSRNGTPRQPSATALLVLGGLLDGDAETRHFRPPPPAEAFQSGKALTVGSPGHQQSQELAGGNAPWRYPGIPPDLLGRVHLPLQPARPLACGVSISTRIINANHTSTTSGQEIGRSKC